MKNGCVVKIYYLTFKNVFLPIVKLEIIEELRWFSLNHSHKWAAVKKCRNMYYILSVDKVFNVKRLLITALYGSIVVAHYFSNKYTYIMNNLFNCRQYDLVQTCL